MIPFRDHNPSGTVPYVTIALVALNVLVFLHEMSLPPVRRQQFVLEYSLQPREVADVLSGEPVSSGQRLHPFATVFTSMFLHGGLLHLLGNMLYLWIFGDNVEDRMGHVKYLLFYVLCGFGAGALHMMFNAGSPVPTVGASGAISGVLGAYMLAFPRARVSTLVVLGIFITVIDLPALVLLGFWFLLQFFSGVGSLGAASAGGVAWWAHVGGFLVGMALLAVFQKPRETRRAYVYKRRQR